MAWEPDRVLLAGGYAKPGGVGVNHAWLYLL